MIREYPPMLTGTPENQTAQLREYLVRLIRYLDEILRDIEPKQETVEVQPVSDAKIKALSNRIDGMMQVLADSTAAGSVTFAQSFGKIPVVITMSGSPSNISTTGFTASAATKWIAVGEPVRR